MTKYDIVLLRGEKERFLEQLQELGLVDITATGWEPDERQRELMASIDRHRAAAERLALVRADSDLAPGKPYHSGDEAWEAYMEASAGLDAVDAQIARVEKEADDAVAWGAFDRGKIDELAEHGVALHFFQIYTKEFDANVALWRREWEVAPVSSAGGITRFVVVAAPGERVAIAAQEVQLPPADHRELKHSLAELRKERAAWAATMRRVAASAELIDGHADREVALLDLSKAAGAGESAADGALVVMEGWATRETSDRVDAMLGEYPALVCIKSKPTPKDDTPTVLRNNRVSRAFEMIGNFYSLPRYGTMDLTAFFGPFYMLFFGFCLGDAGYGLLLVAGYFVLRRAARRGGSRMMAQAANLTLLCGGAATVFGFMAGGFFGVPLAELPAFEGMRERFLTTDNLFVLALALGVVQIMFALVLQVVNRSRQFGFRYTLGTVGWIMVLVAMLYGVAPTLHTMFPTITIHYAVSNPVLYALLGAGGVLMLFFHTPGRNPLLNVGAGLWNTYNDVTGFLGDFLSYIRLFALCLSGGTLALVFNQLAFGMTADMPVVLKQVVIVLILVFGHGINLFMSALGAFVHPMRLTFVEFYKNAGFEAAQREFRPLRKNG